MSTMTYDEYRSHVGRKLGYTGVIANIEGDSERASDVENAIASGQRKFYYAKRPGKPQYVWSFLRRPLALTFAVGVEAIDLPTDFWHLVGSLMYGAGSKLPAIAIVPEEQIRAMRAKKDDTGDPVYAAVRARHVLDGHRYELLLYPRPATSRTVTGQYAYEPPLMDDNHRYPAGGAVHGETLLAACLCAADELLNPESGESLHCTRFAELLDAAVTADEALAGQETDGAWPIDAGGDTDSLCVNRGYLDQMIGLELGFGPNSAAWTLAHRAEVARVRERALRRVYVPDAIDGENRAHRWSFLSPTMAFTTATNEPAIPIPSQVVDVIGPLTYELGASEAYLPVHIVGEVDIRRMQSDDDQTSRPKYAALRTRPRQGGGVTQELLFYPVPDGQYRLESQVRLNPLALPSETSEPPFCNDLGELLIAAVLAVAAEHSGKPQPHYEKRYQAALRSAIIRDRERQTPASIGVMSSWEGEDDAVRIRCVDDPVRGNYSLIYEDE